MRHIIFTLLSICFVTSCQFDARQEKLRRVKDLQEKQFNNFRFRQDSVSIICDMVNPNDLTCSEAQIYYWIMQAYRHIQEEDIALAQAYCDSIKDQRPQTISDELVFSTLYFELQISFLKKDCDVMDLLGSQLDSVSKVINTPVRTFDKLYVIGYSKVMKGRYKEAIPIFQECDSLTIENKLTSQRVSVYNMLGSIARFCKEYNKALEYYLSGLELTKIAGNPKAEGKICYNLSHLYRYTEQFDKAEFYLLRSLNIAKSLHITYDVIRAYNGLGILETEREHYDQALIYFHEGLELRKQGDDIGAIAVAYCNLGRLHRASEHLDSAHYYMEKCYDLCVHNRIGGNLLQSALMNLGDVLSDMDKVDKALELYHEVILNKDSLAFSDIVPEAKQAIAEIYKKQGKFKDCIIQYEEYIEAHRALLERKGTERLIQQMANTEAEEQIDGERKVMEENLESSNRLMISSILGVLALSLLGLYIYRRRSQVKIFSFKSEVEKKVEDDFKKREISLLKSSIKSKKDEEQPRFIKELIFLLEVEKVYKDKDLSLGMLSKKLGTNNTYVSNAINKEFGHGFRTLINYHRVVEAQRLIIEKGAKVSFREIASQAGFASHTSFFKSFKEKTGVTPAQYRDQHLSS